MTMKFCATNANDNKLNKMYKQFKSNEKLLELYYSNQILLHTIIHKTTNYFKPNLKQEITATKTNKFDIWLSQVNLLYARRLNLYQINFAKIKRVKEEENTWDL